MFEILQFFMLSVMVGLGCTSVVSVSVAVVKEIKNRNAIA